MTERHLTALRPSQATQDGDGVAIRRVALVGDPLTDPLLLLDELRSPYRQDFKGGFPPHPHRGMQTLTYMKEGGIIHEDSMGNRGEIRSGGVQWMSAGSGVIHSEMPTQKNGLMQGFQLWVNLPANEKMSPPKYRDIKTSEISSIHDGTTSIKILAGKYKNYLGPITGLSTMLEFFDIKIGKDEFIFEGSEDKNYFVYVFEGSVLLDGEILDSQSGISFTGKVIISTNSESRFLLIGGKPLNEPIFQYGPFVMNTKQEIIEAIEDFQNGKMGNLFNK